MPSSSRIPGFQRALFVVGALYVLMSSSILGRDLRESFAPFSVPESALSSPFFQDAIFWVYFHMLVIGGIMIVVAWTSRELRFQRLFVRYFMVAQAGYLYLDIRSSDTVLGSGLYKGPASIAPAVIGSLFLIVFAVLSFVPARPNTEPAEPEGEPTR